MFNQLFISEPGRSGVNNSCVMISYYLLHIQQNVLSNYSLFI